MRDFFTSGVAALGVLFEQLAACMAAKLLTNRTGPGEKTTKHISRGPAEILVRTRQIERAEGLAALKRQSTMFKSRMRERAGKALSERAAARERRELERRDVRFDTHTMIERSRGADRINRRLFA